MPKNIYISSYGEEKIIEEMDDWYLVNALAKLAQRMTHIEKIKHAADGDDDNKTLLALKTEIIKRIKK